MRAECPKYHLQLRCLVGHGEFMQESPRTVRTNEKQGSSYDVVEDGSFPDTADAWNK